MKNISRVNYSMRQHYDNNIHFRNSDYTKILEHMHMYKEQ